MILTRCKTCCMPTTRPDTAFVDGECSACISYRKRDQIDWIERFNDLRRIIDTMPRNDSGYDCIVPSSGGKDSHWQVNKAISLGLKPLVVTATTCYLTDIGRANIDNLKRHATTLEVTPDPKVRAKLNRIGLNLVGDISWPEHVAIFTTPFRVAADLGIPLILYGENPQEAYGGPDGADQAQEMTRRWRSEFGGFLGLRPQDLVGVDGLTMADLEPYMLPAEEETAKIQALFLGHFYRWDSHANAAVASRMGMQQVKPYPEAWWEHENLDNAMTGIHDAQMFRKFGYGRVCAQISVDVRAGLVSREGAMQIVRERDGILPMDYCGVHVSEICDRLGISVGTLEADLDQHTNWELFKRREIYINRRLVLNEF